MLLTVISMINFPSKFWKIFSFFLTLVPLGKPLPQVSHLPLPPDRTNSKTLPPRHIHKIPKVYLFLSSKPQLVNQKNSTIQMWVEVQVKRVIKSYSFLSLKQTI